MLGDAIIKALKIGDNGAILFLLGGVDVNALIDGRKTALHLAAAYGNAVIVSHLIQSGYIIDAKDEDEITPLMVACYFRHAEVVRILMGAGADPCFVNSKKRSPILYMKLWDNQYVIGLVRQGIEQRTVSRGLSRQLFLDANYNKLLCNSYWNSLPYLPHYECPDRHNEVFLIRAIFSRDFQQVQMILKYRILTIHQHENMYNGLHAAASIHTQFFAEAPNVMQMLYDRGLDVNAKDHRGKTPLHMAVKHVNNQAIIWLLQRGADVHARDDSGRTPLHAARHPFWFTGNKTNVNQTLELLVRNGADIHAILTEERTLLELAKEINEVSTSKLLLRELAILEVHGMILNNRDLEVLEQDNDMRNYYERCRAELRQARDCQILDDTTLFDLLTKNMQALDIHAKNKKFRQTFTNLKVGDNFPIICRSLDKFIQHMEAINISNRASEVLSDALPFLDDLVIQKILTYLSKKELKIIAE